MPRRVRSRGGFRDETAETALAPGNSAIAPSSAALSKSGQWDRHEDELAIGGLPHQKLDRRCSPLVRMMRSGSECRRIEMGPKSLGVDRGGIALALGDFARELLRRFRDLVPRAVVEATTSVRRVLSRVSSSASLSSAQMSPSSPSRSR